MNEFTTGIIVRDRQATLEREARQERLARIAQAGRQPQGGIVARLLAVRGAIGRRPRRTSFTTRAAG